MTCKNYYITWLILSLLPVWISGIYEDIPCKVITRLKQVPQAALAKCHHSAIRNSHTASHTHTATPIHAYTHIHTHTHTHAHTHTYTHTRSHTDNNNRNNSYNNNNNNISSSNIVCYTVLSLLNIKRGTDEWRNNSKFDKTTYYSTETKGNFEQSSMTFDIMWVCMETTRK